MHINISARSRDGRDVMPQVIAGILAHIAEMTVFFNTTESSYQRFGSSKAPRYISWSSENRSQLIRIPAAKGEYRRAELRSPDPLCNPYLAFALLIHAGLDGIRKNLPLPEGRGYQLLHRAGVRQIDNSGRFPERSLRRKPPQRRVASWRSCCRDACSGLHLNLAIECSP